MINVSNEFRQLMEVRTDFKQNAEITFTDGTVLELDESSFTVQGNSVSDGQKGNVLPLGLAVTRSVKISLMNDKEQFAGYDFFGAMIRLYLTFRLSTTVEKIELGTFTVTTPETYGETVIIQASDDMYKADKPYTTALSFPASAQAMLQEVCANCGIALRSTSFANDDFLVQEAPADRLTCRQVIGYIAMIAGGNARIDRAGYLNILTYSLDFSGEYHELKNWKTLKVDTSDITITGIQTTRETEDGTETLLSGEEGYVLSVENPLALGQEDDLVAYLAGILNGKSFRRFEGDHIAYPLAEFMDLVEVYDRKGNAYSSVVTDITFSFFGLTSLKNSAASAVRGGSMYASPVNKAIIAARRLVQEEATQRQIAITKLNETLANASGMYLTKAVQADGSTINYLHDKPTLAESANVIKVTAEAVGLSTDGGKTYPYGVTVNGETILKIIETEGLNADWITAGTIKSKDGTSAVIDLDEGNVDLTGTFKTKGVTIGGETVHAELDGQHLILYSEYNGTSKAVAVIGLSDANLQPYLLLDGIRIAAGSVSGAGVIADVITPTSYDDVPVDMDVEDLTECAANVKFVNDAIDHANSLNSLALTLLESKLTPKVYTVAGKLWDCTGGTSIGYGTACIVIQNSHARIDFSVKIETSGSVSNIYSAGISRDLIAAINANIPTITPVSGGKVEIFSSDGILSTGMMGYGARMSITSDGVHWAPNRVYTTSGSLGAWGDSQYKTGMIITGTCYGTVNE